MLCDGGYGTHGRHRAAVAGDQDESDHAINSYVEKWRMKAIARQRRRGMHRKGFTLLEVLLVMAILIILASVVTISYTAIQRNMINPMGLR